MKRARAIRQPLAGRRILVTRARKQAATLAAALQAHGATVINIPAIEIRPPRSVQPLERALRQLANYDWLILTSVNGVEALFAHAGKLRISSTEFKALKIAAIGPATARAIRARGLRVSVVPEEYVAESVVAALRSRVAGTRVLLARARVARDVIPRELRRLGARVDVVEAYETVVPRGAAARFCRLLASSRQRPDAITFTSSSTVRNFVQAIGRNMKQLDGVTLASIGPVTSSTLREFGLAPDIEARSFTMDGLVSALVRHLR